MLENGSEVCSCKKKMCERHGKCSECIAYHKTNKRYTLPYCKHISKRQANKTAGSAPGSVPVSGRKNGDAI